jgi:hypothetical protein
MISKFINLGWTKNGSLDKMDIADQYLNRVDDLAYITPYNPSDAFSTDFLTDYPKSNLHNYRLSKEARLNTFQNGSPYFAGISCNLASGYGNWNTMVIQFNKLNNNFIDHIKSNKSIVVEWERIDTPGLIDGWITFKAGNTFEALVSSGKIDPNEGTILIDADVVTQCQIDGDIGTSWDESEYQINIYMSSTEDFEYFGISSVTFTNSLDIYIDEYLKFNRSNLDDITRNKRTGTLFRKENSELKALSSAISLLEKDELLSFEKFVRFNKSKPFFFFPYCNSEDSTSLNYSLINLEMGGLYAFPKNWKVNNNSFNIFNVDIDLEEHK